MVDTVCIDADHRVGGKLWWNSIPVVEEWGKVMVELHSRYRGVGESYGGITFPLQGSGGRLWWNYIPVTGELGKLWWNYIPVVEELGKVMVEFHSRYRGVGEGYGGIHSRYRGVGEVCYRVSGKILVESYSRSGSPKRCQRH